MIKTPPEVVLGFDFGTKRIGIAVGQTITKTARPLKTIETYAGEPNWEEIVKIIQHWQPDALLVGIPLNMDGTEQYLTELAKRFAKQLEEHSKLPVYGVDERLTTKDAREKIFSKGGFKALQKNPVDSVAAQIIIETWFMQSDHS